MYFFNIESCLSFLKRVCRMNITQAIEQQITGRSTFHVPGEKVVRFFKQCFNFAKDNPHVNKSSYRKGKNTETHLPAGPEDESEPYNLAESTSGGEPESVAHADAMAKWGINLGQGALLGGLRGVMSYYGCRGTVADVVFMGLTSPGGGSAAWRDMNENVPLWVFFFFFRNLCVFDFNGLLGRSQIVLDALPDIAHQTVYAFVTGFLCDHWVN